VNPGDTVRIYHPGHTLHGQVGELEFIADAGCAYVIIGYQSYPIHPADLQPLEEPA
jgi:hypothetical protein